MKPNCVNRQTVVFADGRKRVRNVHCLDEKNGARVGEVWIGDRMARVIEFEVGVWRLEILKPNWVTRQTVVFADGRKRVRNVHCVDEKRGALVGEAWIGGRMARVIEVAFGVWREEKPKE